MNRGEGWVTLRKVLAVRGGEICNRVDNGANVFHLIVHQIAHHHDSVCAQSVHLLRVPRYLRQINTKKTVSCTMPDIR